MSRPYYNRERKNWGLRASNRPKKHDSLAGTVMVTDEGGLGYAYFWFEESFVQAVGKAVVVGVGPQQPCYLRAVFSMGGQEGKTCVFVCPFGEGHGVHLLDYQGAIPWIERINRR